MQLYFCCHNGVQGPFPGCHLRLTVYSPAPTLSCWTYASTTLLQYYHCYCLRGTKAGSTLLGTHAVLNRQMILRQKSLAHVKSETNNAMCNVSPGWDKKHFLKKCSLMRGAGSGGVEENNQQHPSLSDNRHWDNVWKVHSIIFYRSSFLPSVSNKLQWEDSFLSFFFFFYIFTSQFNIKGEKQKKNVENTHRKRC